MIKVRLARLGKRNDPFYRIVAIDERKKRGGAALEILGHWHPAKNDKKIDKKAIDNWVSKGAQLSTGVRNLLEGKPKKKKEKVKKEE